MTTPSDSRPNHQTDSQQGFVRLKRPTPFPGAGVTVHDHAHILLHEAWGGGGSHEEERSEEGSRAIRTQEGPPAAGEWVSRARASGVAHGTFHREGWGWEFPSAAISKCCVRSHVHPQHLDNSVRFSMDASQCSIRLTVPPPRSANPTGVSCRALCLQAEGHRRRPSRLGEEGVHRCRK